MANEHPHADPRRNLVVDPQDGAALKRFLATLNNTLSDTSAFFALARRAALLGELDPVTVRRLLLSAHTLDPVALGRWAEAATLPRRHPLRLIGALLRLRERHRYSTPAQSGTEFKDFAHREDWLRFVGAVEPVPSSVASAIEVTLMKIAFHREYLEGGLIEEALSAGLEASRFSRYVRQRLYGRRVRGFTSNWTQAIGHMVVFIHILYGHRAGMFDWDTTVLAGGRIANQPLFDMAQAALGPVTIASSDKAYCEHHGSTLPEFVDGAFVDIFEACRRVDAVARARGETVLPVPPRPAELDTLLARHGLTPDRPFVTLHCREDGFKLKGVHGPRNATISNYLPAIRHLVASGYTVVRIGDATMSPLPSSDGVLDYALSDGKSPALDIALQAHAEFHIGCSSGLSLVPLLFGRPCLFLNWYPMTLLPWGSQTWTILKRLIGRDTGETVTDAGILFSKGLVTDAMMLDHLGFRLADNTPDEILTAVRDFSAQLDATHSPARKSVFLHDSDGARVDLKHH